MLMAALAGLGGLCVGLLLAFQLMARRVNTLEKILVAERTRQQSLSTTYGRITEQWFPLMRAYPYDPQHFRFLGSPVDGIQFEEDRIIFIEFKTNGSRLTAQQQQMRDLVESGCVEWETYHFTNDANNENDKQGDGFDDWNGDRDDGLFQLDVDCGSREVA